MFIRARSCIRTALYLLLAALCLAAFRPPVVSAATYTVTKTADTNDGSCNADCSFREAVTAANTNTGNDTVEFSIPASDSGYVAANGETQAYWTIILNSVLSLTDDSGTYINGYTQTGASRNTAPVGETINTKLSVRIYFNDDTYQLGFNLVDSDNNHITGLDLVKERAYSSSLYNIYGNNNWIEGNFFGTNISGTVMDGGGAFRFMGQSNNNIVGTNGDGSGDTGERNLFGGNQSYYGYILFWGGGSSGNTIAGNYFGTSVTGKTCLATLVNRSVIHIETTTSTIIGTDYDGVSDSEEANIMGCVSTSHMGVIRMLAGSNNNHIQGNYIGISPNGDALGTLAGTGAGAVNLFGTITGNIIKGNTLSNGDYGIRCRTGCVHNTFSENVTFGNVVRDISVGLLPNDTGDTDTGPNDQMNYPVIDHAWFDGIGTYTIEGKLDGNPSEAPFTVEVCKSSGHSSGYGGCQQSLATTTVTAPGPWSVSVTVTGDTVTAMSKFTALATNVNGSTSEFGPNVQGRIRYTQTPAVTYQISPETLYVTGGDVAPIRDSHTGVQQVKVTVEPQTFYFNAFLSAVVQSDSGGIRTDVLGASTDAAMPNGNSVLAAGTVLGIRTGSDLYWQIGGVQELWFKAYPPAGSDMAPARIIPELQAKQSRIYLSYEDRDLIPPGEPDYRFSPETLRIAKSMDRVNWTVFPEVRLDTENRLVSVTDYVGGYYMIVGK